jgi:hypothetical protein
MSLSIAPIHRVRRWQGILQRSSRTGMRAGRIARAELTEKQSEEENTFLALADTVRYKAGPSRRRRG